jgi:hypothetical protein
LLGAGRAADGQQHDGGNDFFHNLYLSFARLVGL